MQQRGVRLAHVGRIVFATGRDEGRDADEGLAGTDEGRSKQEDPLSSRIHVPLRASVRPVVGEPFSISGSALARVIHDSSAARRDPLRVAALSRLARSTYRKCLRSLIFRDRHHACASRHDSS